MPRSDAPTYSPSTNDDQAPRPSRSIRTRDYTLPRPYRKKTFVEDQAPMSRLRIALLACSGLVISSLIVALALLAKDALDAPPLLVIAAPTPAPPRALALPAALPMSAAPLAQLEIPVALPAAPITVVRIRGHRLKAPVAARAPSKSAAPAPAPDPDVVLIAAILSLTRPSPAPAGEPPRADVTLFHKEKLSLIIDQLACYYSASQFLIHGNNNEFVHHVRSDRP